jgi:hypothetical protein
LSKYLEILRGFCPVEFVSDCPELCAHGFNSCQGPRPPQGEYLAFKRLFKFAPYTYCFNCGTPQDHNGNDEAPPCHRTHKYAKGVQCPWADLLFVVAYCLWQHPGLRDQLVNAFHLAPTLSLADYTEWLAGEDKRAGEYTKLVEVFLWYCDKWHASP